MSPSSSPQDTTSLLATSEALRRIEALSGRRRQSSKSSQTSQDPPSHVQQTSVPLQRTQSNPKSIQYQSQLFVEPAMPQTPTTRRRQMLATELPEDLRLSESEFPLFTPPKPGSDFDPLDLIWERRSRTPLYPPKHTSALKASASAHDLPQSERDQAAQTEHTLRMQRQDSQPVVCTSPNGSSSPCRNQQDAMPGNGTGPSRRRQPNLLSGGAILRPLTKSHLEPSPPTCGREPAPNDPKARSAWPAGEIYRQRRGPRKGG